MDKRYCTLDAFLRKRFGRKIFKVPLDGGFTCPNKDGSKGVNGCVFCSPSGSGDFAGDRALSLEEQYATIKARLLRKWPDAGTIAYFQANTNTYAHPDRLKTLYETALSLDEDCVGLSIATRCDALETPVLDVLSSFNARTYVQVELGLQTVHEKTAERINRGHDLACVEKAIVALRKRSIDVVVHIINGLPGEDESMMLKTARWLANQDIQGVKFHMLCVLRHTALGEQYENAPFALLSLERYVDILAKQIALLRPDIVVHRLSGDAPEADLIAPTWTKKKFVVMNELDKRLKTLDIRQGDAYEPDV